MIALGGYCGLDPEAYTLRELTAAADMRDERAFRIAWQNTLAIAAQIYNVNRPARRSPIALESFNPYRDPPRPPAPLTADQDAILCKMFPAEPKGP